MRAIVFKLTLRQIIDTDGSDWPKRKPAHLPTSEPEQAADTLSPAKQAPCCPPSSLEADGPSQGPPHDSRLAT